MGNLSETLAVITENLKSIAHSLTAKKFLFTTIIILFFVFLSVLTINYFTGFLYFSRLNKKIGVIERIEHKSNTKSYKEKVEGIYFDVLKELSEYDTKKNFTIDKNSKKYDRVIRILVSLILPLLILLSSIGGSDFKNVFIGVIMFVIIFGFIAALIPTIYKLWVTSIIIVVIEIIVLLIMMRVYKA